MLAIHVATLRARTTLMIVLFNWVLVSIFCAGGAVGLQPVLNARSAYVGTRAVHTVWCCARVTIALIGASSAILYGIAGYAVDPSFDETRRELALLNGTFTLFDGRWPQQILRADDPPAVIVAAAVYSVATAALTVANRRRLRKLMLRLSGYSGTCKAAAMVAAMIAGQSVEEAHRKAQESFFALPFSALAEKDLVREEGATACVAQSPSRRLLGQIRPMRLGACDAFISHSWSDRGSEKYTLLAEWADGYRRSQSNRSVALALPPMVRSTSAGSRGKHEVYVWLDAACIDQNNIEAALPCLPIFLAGCKRLVILAGPSYTRRLWCVVELFVFMQMGGSFDRISVLPLLAEKSGNTTIRNLYAKFHNFRCEDAECFKLEDKEKLMAVIEVGFGGFDDFDALVREVLLNGLSREGSLVR